MRRTGLASGLALAVRPAGPAEVSARKGGSRRCFLRSGSYGGVRKEAFRPGGCDIFTAPGAPAATVAAPTKAGTFTFSVHVHPFLSTTPSTDGTYSITVASKPHK